MIKDKKTKVIFRRWKKTLDEHQGIVAIFPEVPYGATSLYCSTWEYKCFLISGGHGGCCPEGRMENTVPASQEEYVKDAEILKTLFGYDLEIIESIPPNARDIRREALDCLWVED